MEIRRNVILAPYTSFGIGGPAQFFAEPANLAELRQALRFAREQGLPITVITFGTDVLVSDDGIEGLVLCLRRLKGLEVHGRLLVAHAGDSLSRVCRAAAEAGLDGLAELFGIPGAMGGSVAKNAGAYGRELGELVSWVELITPEGELVALHREHLGFRYRGSDLPQKGILVRVALELVPGDRGKVLARMAEVAEKRRRNQPVSERSAGCIFKNPPGQPAAKLIEAAGLKGTRIGDAEVSRLHANFIVNKGKAKAADVLALVDLVKERVHERFGVLLEEEIEFLGVRR